MTGREQSEPVCKAHGCTVPEYAWGVCVWHLMARRKHHRRPPAAASTTAEATS